MVYREVYSNPKKVLPGLGNRSVLYRVGGIGDSKMGV